MLCWRSEKVLLILLGSTADATYQDCTPEVRLCVHFLLSEWYSAADTHVYGTKGRGLWIQAHAGTRYVYTIMTCAICRHSIVFKKRVLRGHNGPQ
jgi:hypothetical protein